MRILYVCTANVCRSRSGEALLRDAVAGRPELAGIEIQSAGTWAVPGSGWCDVAPALVGRTELGGAQRLDADLVRWADLVLTAEREHRSSVVGFDTAARSRAFTVRQAARIADWLVDGGMVEAGRQRARAAVLAAGGQAAAGDAGWAGQFPDGDPRALVTPMTGDVEARRAWLVQELDAARGMAVAGEPDPEPAGRRRFWQRRPAESAQSALHDDDIPDPHVMGMPLHATVDALLVPATASLVRVLSAVSAEA